MRNGPEAASLLQPPGRQVRASVELAGERRGNLALLCPSRRFTLPNCFPEKAAQPRPTRLPLTGLFLNALCLLQTSGGAQALLSGGSKSPAQREEEGDSPRRELLQSGVALWGN